MANPSRTSLANRSAMRFATSLGNQCRLVTITTIVQMLQTAGHLFSAAKDSNAAESYPFI